LALTPFEAATGFGQRRTSAIGEAQEDAKLAAANTEHAGTVEPEVR
jgi:hypothetical protein